MIRISYKSRRLQKVCEDAEAAEKQYGAEMAEKIQMRIDQIRAADSIEMLVRNRIGRCHQLKGNRKEQFAMDLTHPYRLVFRKINEELIAVEVLEIVDYH